MGAGMKLRFLSSLSLFISTLLTACGAGTPLAVGDAAPVVSAASDNGQVVNLADIYAKSTYTLVYFYPKAGTSGCTAQGCSLRDAYEELTDKGVTVVGVSTDTVEEQRAFKAAQNFPFTLLADTNKKVLQAFGVPTYPNSNAARRQAFLIKDGKIVWADYTASTSQQAADVLKVLGTL